MTTYRKFSHLTRGHAMCPLTFLDARCHRAQPTPRYGYTATFPAVL